MFKDATTFDYDLTMWDTTKVTNMEGMFQNASSFDSFISNWNTSNVTNMNYMFYNASSFSQETISEWDVKKLTTYKNIFCSTGLSLEQISQIEEEWVKKNSKIGGLSSCSN